MLNNYFSASKMLGHLRSGPSGLHLDGFATALKRQGYTDDTAGRYVRAAAHLGHVLAGRGGWPRDIDLQAFSEHLRTCRCPRAKGGRHNHHTIYGARLFRRYLVEIGVCRPAAVTATPVEPSLITSFKAWLRRHRGASDATIRLYARDVARLLMALGDDPATWDAAAVRTTFMDLASTSGRGTIEKMTTSLRAFLRYLAVGGRCRAGLDSAVPAYAHWRLADMPRYLATEQVNCLIAACNGEAPARRRDRAIILLLVRLGLRAGDAPPRGFALPLPQDVGDAIAAYVDCRPKHHTSAHVFLRTIAPYGSFRRGDGMSSWVRRAMQRAGIITPFKGAHALRHTAATEMLRHGVALEKIGLVLRHRGIDTTAYYAKADVALLKQIAQPWPEVL